MDIIRRLLNRNESEKEARKIMTEAHSMQSRQRKPSYATWDCISCSSSYYYRVRSCPLCESQQIKAVRHSI